MGKSYHLGKSLICKDSSVTLNPKLSMLPEKKQAKKKFDVTCPSCNAKIRIPAGRSHCPKCREQITLNLEFDF